MVLWLKRMAWLLLEPLSDRILASLVERYLVMSHIIPNTLPYLIRQLISYISNAQYFFHHIWEKNTKFEIILIENVHSINVDNIYRIWWVMFFQSCGVQIIHEFVLKRFVSVVILYFLCEKRLGCEVLWKIVGGTVNFIYVAFNFVACCYLVITKQMLCLNQHPNKTSTEVLEKGWKCDSIIT